MPELQKLANEFGGKGFVVLAVDVDMAGAADEVGMAGQLALVKPRIEVFLRQSGITLPIFLVDGRTQMSLGLDQIPVSILLDREGGVVRAYRGYSAEAVQDLRRQLLELLPERSGKGGK